MGGRGADCPPDTKNREGEQKSGRGKRGKGKKKEGKEEKREKGRKKREKEKRKGRRKRGRKRKRKGKEKRREERGKGKKRGRGTFCAYVRTPKFIRDIEGVPVCKLPPTFTETFRPRPKLKNIVDLYETLINIMFHRYLNISNGMNFA